MSGSQCHSGFLVRRNLDSAAHRGCPHGHTHPHWRRAPAGPPHLQDLFFVDVLLMAVRRVCHGPSDRSGCASLLMSAEDDFCLGRVALHLSSSGEDLHRTIAPFSLGLLLLFSCWVGSGAELVRLIPRLTWALVSELSAVGCAWEVVKGCSLGEHQRSSLCFFSQEGSCISGPLGRWEPHPFQHTGHEELMESVVR